MTTEKFDLEKVNREAEYAQFEGQGYSKERIAGIPLAPYLFRYAAGAYAIAGTVVSATFIVGVIASFIGGGLGTPGGDGAFGIGCVVGFIVGLFGAIIVSTIFMPKQDVVLQEKRAGSIGKALFFSAIVGVFFGFYVFGFVGEHYGLNKNNFPIHYVLLIVGFSGAFPMSVIALVWMAFEDQKNKEKVINSFEKWTQSKQSKARTESS